MQNYKVTILILIMLMLFGNNCEALELTASWYSVASLKREGTWQQTKGVMANGKQFDNEGLTCATNLYSLGTILIVTNSKNNKSVVVTVTDRIGKRFTKTRIDLSRKAFSLLDDLNKGLITVNIQPY